MRAFKTDFLRGHRSECGSDVIVDGTGIGESHGWGAGLYRNSERCLQLRGSRQQYSGRLSAIHSVRRAKPVNEGVLHCQETACRPDRRLKYFPSAIMRRLLSATSSVAIHKSESAPVIDVRNRPGMTINAFKTLIDPSRATWLACPRWEFFIGMKQFTDLDDLEAKNAGNTALARWVSRVKKVWQEATDSKSDDPRERIRARIRFQKRLIALAEPYCKNGDDAPVHRVLATRTCRFANELFSFVEHPSVTPDNNAAKRAVRPVVIYRKVTGGTRSDTGAETTAALMSLLHTWAAHQLNPFAECMRMLKALPSQVLSHGD